MRANVSKNIWHAGNRGARPKPVSLIRRDFATAALIEQAIVMQKQIGTRCAALFLDDKGVSVEVAVRVLLRPHERRKYTVYNSTDAVLSS